MLEFSHLSHSQVAAVLRLFILLLFSCQISTAAGAIIIHYPAIAQAGDPRSEYPLALLRLALAESDKDYQLISTESAMSKSRALSFLKESQVVDVVWTMTSIEREQDYLPIRIPIFKGLSGYRLLLIRKAAQHKFHRELSLPQLKRLLYAQGHDWVDTSIMRRNGFAVLGASNYEALFSMLEKGRVDAVPRNAAEVIPESLLFAEKDIVVEENWVFYYPTASYFFVDKSNVELASDLKKGLQQLIDDGRFDTLFQTTFGAQLKQLELDKRKLIMLENPFLPPETPLKNKKLWYYQPSINQ